MRESVIHKQYHWIRLFSWNKTKTYSKIYIFKASLKVCNQTFCFLWEDVASKRIRPVRSDWVYILNVIFEVWYQLMIVMFLSMHLGFFCAISRELCYCLGKTMTTKTVLMMHIIPFFAQISNRDCKIITATQMSCHVLLTLDICYTFRQVTVTVLYSFPLICYDNALKIP